ncbi:phosphoglycolate phosphatase [Thiomonas sp.]|jgi:phosphoglycolate phosphatase|uniref:phosphoglycolate phosphatase n=1 Tax=Thiomonas sp. TaxID=2047785 RepID=UPI002630A2AA|nr:phosphoglycolate phosphatase [Thiomonas sp.]
MNTLVRSAPAASRAPYRSVLFDLDGTLADSAPDLAEALNRMRRQRGMAALPLEQLRPMASHGARGLLQAGLGAQPQDPDWNSLREEFLANYEASICVLTRPFDGIESLLRELQRRAIPWGIVTNKLTRYTDALLSRLDLGAPPGCVVSGDTTARAKPAPDPLLHAAAALRIAPAGCLYVGDDLRDVQAALAAGMDAAAAAYGYGGPQASRDWGAQHVLDHPGELLRLL